VKLFKTSAIDTVKVWQVYFDFELPSVVIGQRKNNNFLSRLDMPTLACSLVKIIVKF